MGWFSDQHNQSSQVQTVAEFPLWQTRIHISHHYGCNDTLDSIRAATTNRLNRLKSIIKSVGNEFHYRFVVSRDYYATQYVAEMFEY